MSNGSLNHPFQFRLLASLREGLLLALALACLTGRSQAENMALKLDGDGSYVELPTDGYENITQATVEAWVKWDALNGYSRVIEFGERWRSLCIINHAQKSDLRYYVYPQNAKDDEALRYNIWATNAIRTGEWIHVAAVSGPGGMVLYLNGWRAGEHTNTASFAEFAGNARCFLGHGMVGNSTDKDFQGEMDEIRIWNYRRTASQIREGMFTRLNGDEAGLVHLWNFDSGTAKDATARAAHGKLIGNAKIVPSSLELHAAVTPPPPPVATAPSAATPVPAAPQPPQVVEVQTNTSNAVGWWIAGAITFLAIVLAWLALMFRRSGLGSEKLVGTQPTVSRIPAEAALPERTGPAPVPKELKEQALAELTSFAKESLVQGLFSQRAALLEAQKQAQQDLAELEARLTNLDVHDRILAYEARIADLERQVASKGEEVEGLTKATLQLLRKKLAEEKGRESTSPRFN